jgi:hypothetical protein
MLCIKRISIRCAFFGTGGLPSMHDYNVTKRIKHPGPLGMSSSRLNAYCLAVNFWYFMLRQDICCADQSVLSHLPVAYTV